MQKIKIMNLNERAKYEFEKWYPHRDEYSLQSFYALTPSMQFGVYVDWFENVGYDVFVLNWRGKWIENIYKLKGDESITDGIHENRKGFKTREQAREKAILKGNEIYNKL